MLGGSSEFSFNYHSYAPNPVRAIHLTIFYRFKNIVLMLLNNGFKADTKDASNRTPLLWAALLGRTKNIKLLLSLNNDTAHWKRRDDEVEAASGSLPYRNAVEVNYQGSTGTPLSWAA